MGDDVTKRSNWIETNVDFEESDTFEILYKG
jgi:hypothetical protein